MSIGGLHTEVMMSNTCRMFAYNTHLNFWVKVTTSSSSFSNIPGCIAFHSTAVSSFEGHRFLTVVGGRVTLPKLDTQISCPIFVLDLQTLQWLSVDLLPSYNIPPAKILQAVLISLPYCNNRYGEPTMPYVYFGGFHNAHSQADGALGDVYVLSIKIEQRPTGPVAVALWEKPKITSTSSHQDVAIWAHSAALQKFGGHTDKHIMRMVRDFLLL
jgi:hypothetical protein